MGGFVGAFLPPYITSVNSEITIRVPKHLLSLDVPYMGREGGGAASKFIIKYSNG